MNELLNEGNIVGSRMNLLGIEQLAYIAGFLDGDGCITSNYERSQSKASYRVRVRVSFTQISSRKEVLDTLRIWIGSGTVATYEHNNMAEYVIRDQKIVESLISDLLPHLIVKKRHAKIALQILQLKKQSYFYTPESLEQLKHYTIAIKALNNYPKRIVLTP